MRPPSMWVRSLVSGGGWWTGKPGMLQSMGLQRVGHDWGTELNWANIKFIDKGGKAEAMVSSCTFMMSYEWLALELSPFEEAMFLHSPDTHWVSAVCRALFSVWEYSSEPNGFEISMPYQSSFSFTIFSTYDLKSFLQSINVSPLCVFCWEL